MDKQTTAQVANVLELVAYTCPQCSGILRKVEDNYYLCPAGHMYTPRALVTKQTEVIEAALWTALRTLEEQSKVLTELVKDEQVAANSEISCLLENSAHQSRAYADDLRKMLGSSTLPVMPV